MCVFACMRVCASLCVCVCVFAILRCDSVGRLGVPGGVRLPVLPAVPDHAVAPSLHCLTLPCPGPVQVGLPFSPPLKQPAFSEPFV